MYSSPFPHENRPVPDRPLPPSRRRKPTPIPRKARYPDLYEEEILAWADAHYRRTGNWPRKDSGFIEESPRDKWLNVDAALRMGLRGLQPGSSLARLLARERGVRNRKGLPAYDEEELLRWADAHRERTGNWPMRYSGAIVAAPGETWMAVDMALCNGLRGLPGDSSLAKLLAQHRGVRNKADLPDYTEEQILSWADAHRQRTGRWPIVEAGAIEDAPGETWNAVNHALARGTRGLPGGSSLARLLAARRGVLHRLAPPALTLEQVLGWADVHFARTGRWPKMGTGPIEEAPGETWNGVDGALREGRRGLPGGTSLARLLEERRGAPYHAPGPDIRAERQITAEQILAWVDAHRGRTGKWPSKNCGRVTDAPGHTWPAIDLALVRGHRGLPGGSSLAMLLAEQRGKPTRADLIPLTPERILACADGYYRRSGCWPSIGSGAVEELPGDTWKSLHRALVRGSRGLPGGSSLAQLLAQERGVRNPHDLPPLSEARVLQWADAHFHRTGQWPRRASGAIEGAAGETWSSVDGALRGGSRGLPGGSSLARLLQDRRGVRNPKAVPELSVRLVLRWADAYHARHGRWPQVTSGPIEEAPGETWSGVESALQHGTRGFPGGASLARVLFTYRKVPIRGRRQAPGPP